MKLKTIITQKWFFVLGLQACLLSCEKYLSKQPDNSVAVPKTLNDLQALLDNSADMNLQTTPNFGESSSDNFFLPDADYDGYDIQERNTYIWMQKSYTFINDWSAAYTPVYIANYCLDQIKNIPLTADNTSEWNNVYGSALFFKSYNYLNLLWTFSKAFDSTSSQTDLGIVLRQNSDFNLPSVRSSVKDCYDQVISGAQTALKYLPDHPANVMRPSKSAVYGLLARTYLSMRVYDSSYKYANLCLQMENYLMDYNGDDNINASASPDAPFIPFNKEIIFYTEMTTFNDIGGPFHSKTDTILMQQYDDNDLRKNLFFTQDETGYYYFIGTYAGSFGIAFSGIATDEMYLIRAESLARVGQISDALDDLNFLLKKRWNNSVPYADITATTSGETTQKILLERRKELYRRGLRWIDLKRLNKEGENITLTRHVDGQTTTLAPNDPYYALPLPADVISTSGIQQN